MYTTHFWLVNIPTSDSPCLSIFLFLLLLFCYLTRLGNGKTSMDAVDSVCGSIYVCKYEKYKKNSNTRWGFNGCVSVSVSVSVCVWGGINNICIYMYVRTIAQPGPA